MRHSRLLQLWIPISIITWCTFSFHLRMTYSQVHRKRSCLYTYLSTWEERRLSCMRQSPHPTRSRSHLDPARIHREFERGFKHVWYRIIITINPSLGRLRSRRFDQPRDLSTCKWFRNSNSLHDRILMCLWSRWSRTERRSWLLTRSCRLSSDSLLDLIPLHRS